MPQLKADRKAHRVARKVEKELGIATTEEPSKVGSNCWPVFFSDKNRRFSSQHLMVCNAGLTTGASREDLVEVFQRFGPIESIHLLPEKSYSFVSFSKESQAQEALQQIRGKVGLTEANPLYLAFVEALPDFEFDEWQNGGETPEGLTLTEDFVTPEEEAKILENLDFEDKAALKNRLVTHFGHDFIYGKNAVDPEPNGRQFPEFWHPVIIQRDIRVQAGRFNVG